MPARFSKNGRNIRKPIVPEQLVDVDTETAGTPITRSPGPPVSPVLLDIPYLEDDFDVPPIPIPVPRTQTPQFVSKGEYVASLPEDTESKLKQEFNFDDSTAMTATAITPSTARRPTVSHMYTSPAAAAPSFVQSPPQPQPQLPRHISGPEQPSHHVHNPFSYGYVHGPPSHSSSPTTRTAASGLARTIRAAVSPVRATMSPAKRPAVPVVDLGNVAVGSGIEHRAVGPTLGKERAQREQVVWARWDVVSWQDGRHPRTSRLLFIAYPSTLRLWDTTDLGNVSEVLRLRISWLDIGWNGVTSGSGDGITHGNRDGFQNEEGKGEEESEVRLVHAGVLPAKEGEDRPWIGLAFTTGTFVIYSLKSHRVVTRFHVGHPAPGKGGGASIESFQASEDVIVVSTTCPPTLHVYSATTFTLLTEIPGSRLALYVPPSPFLTVGGVGMGMGQTPASVKAKATLSSAFGSALGSLGQQQHYPQRGNNGSGHRTTSRSDTMYDTTVHTTHTTSTLGDLTGKHDDHDYTDRVTASLSTPAPDPKPVYALSRRLLAYASVLPSAAGSVSYSRQSASSGLESVQPAAAAAAQSVWEGMRTLGGLAVSAARSRVGSAGGSGAGAGTGAVTGGVAGVGRFFSRSAPERGGYGAERGRGRGDSASGMNGSGAGDGDGHSGVNIGGEGVYVTVVDLKTLSDDVSRKGKTDLVVEFKVDKERGLSKLVFSPDGCSISAVARDGTGIRVYQVRPHPAGGHHAGEETKEGESAAWNVYHLRRGRTGAIVDGLEWSRDGRWVAMGTRKRTVHLFGVNPYGGKIDMRSHWEGKVRNVDEPQTMPLEMGPLVRLRSGVVPAPGPAQRAYAPLAFIFVEPGEMLPKHLLPVASSPASPHALSQAHPRSYSSQHTDSGASPPHSPHTLSKRRPTNFQDVLIFDPVDASLALRRVMLEMHPREQGIKIGMGIGLGALGAGVTSISLPGMGFAGAVAGSGSPSSSAGGSSGSGGGSGGGGAFRQRVNHQWQQGQEGQMELGARESTVMTWNLGGWGGGDIRRIMGAERGEDMTMGGRVDWLAQAELSTCSQSSKILPRSIYLSHQFSFYTLGEDYHALIRRYQLDIGGFKINVRREVQVSAYSVDAGESFVEGFAAPRDIRHHRTLSASFDEPLASALANELEHSRITSVLPMFPNGTPGSRPQSFRSALPIRTFGDGMSESFGRLRREINRVRSPHLRPTSDSAISASVPLEFDEEDEDFAHPEMLLDVPGATSSRETSQEHAGGSGPTVSTPATSEDDWDRKMETKEDAWGGWSENDRRAVEEVERFDDIDVLGLLDEEQQQERRMLMERQVEGAGRVEGNLKRRGRGRKR